MNDKIYSLKPCPWCGRDTDLRACREESYNSRWESWAVCCMTCKVAGPSSTDCSDIAVERWNIRLN